MAEVTEDKEPPKKRKKGTKKKSTTKKKRGIELTEEEAKQLDLDTEKQKLRQNPEVAKLINRYKEIGFRWNQVTSFLAGKTTVSPEFSTEEQISWLVQCYHYDVLFLLQQLGVVEVPENAEHLPTQQEIKDAVDPE